MNNNPEQRQPPSPSPSQSSYAWKVFFWINATLMALALLNLPFIKNMSPLDYIDFALSLAATVGLYGFAFAQAVGTVVFWRYLFYAVFIDVIVYALLLPLFGVPRYGQEFQLDGFYALELVLAATILYALNQYAYKRKDIWQ